MSERPQVNIRLDRALVEEIDRLAREDAIDRSEMARRLLDAGLAARRMQRALEAYRHGDVTAWRAARMAGVSLFEMLDRIHEAGIPHDLDPEVLAAVGSAMGIPRALHEDGAAYGTRPSDDDPGTLGAGGGRTEAHPGVGELQVQFRPDHVDVLFVGESSASRATHFYRADTSLFRAMREAFAHALGPSIPDGPRFLREFQDRGCWLVDLVDRPVAQLPGHERRGAVDTGVAGLGSMIRDLRPARVVAVKSTIVAAVRRSVVLADSGAEVLALPFPVRQWRAVFIRDLAEALRRWRVEDARGGDDDGR